MLYTSCPLTLHASLLTDNFRSNYSWLFFSFSLAVPFVLLLHIRIGFVFNFTALDVYYICIYAVLYWWLQKAYNKSIKSNPWECTWATFFAEMVSNCLTLTDDVSHFRIIYSLYYYYTWKYTYMYICIFMCATVLDVLLLARRYCCCCCFKSDFHKHNKREKLQSLTVHTRTSS